MSNSRDSDSTDGTTGWPCSSVSNLNPLKNNVIVFFPNGYFDYNGNSIVKGGVCIIEPINNKFLEIFYGIKLPESNTDQIHFNEEKVKMPGGSWKDSAKKYYIKENILYAQLKSLSTCTGRKISLISRKSYTTYRRSRPP